MEYTDAVARGCGDAFLTTVCPKPTLTEPIRWLLWIASG